MTSGLPEKILRLHRTFERAHLPHAFGGALALAYYATPRTTIDIDVNIFVTPDRFEAIARVLRRLGAERLPEGALVTRDAQFRAWWGRNPIDCFLVNDPIHEAMRTAARIVPFLNATIPILAPEHLIVAKTAFNRPKDWIDLEQMLIACDLLDVAEIRRWLHHLLGDTDPRTLRLEHLMTSLRGA